MNSYNGFQFWKKKNCSDKNITNTCSIAHFFAALLHPQYVQNNLLKSALNFIPCQLDLMRIRVSANIFCVYHHNFVKSKRRKGETLWGTDVSTSQGHRLYTQVSSSDIWSYFRTDPHHSKEMCLVSIGLVCDVWFLHMPTCLNIL